MAFVLAVLWLPAAWHCGLESLAIAAEGAEEHGCCAHVPDAAASTDAGCLADHCGVFEDGHVRSGDDVSPDLQPPAPGLLASDSCVAGELREPELVPNGGSSRRQDAGADPWHVVRRAAAWSNAPGSNIG